MTKTRIIGDIHGMIYDYQAHSIGNFEGPTIQIGDFGIGYHNDYWHENIAAWQGVHPHHRFIRGNHDDPSRCKTMPGFIKDGTIENDVMFIGGAWSIDGFGKTHGMGWWRDEECSIEQFNQLIDIYATMKPRVIITHDGPTKVTNEMFIQTGLAIGGANARQIDTRTGTALQAMLDIHQPEEWYFGHWHHTMLYKYGKTMFHCIGILDYIDVEL